ncbi:DnaJ domain-containing protein [Anabaena sp. WFMT]|uniref:DnaJ domain-containing protein n=1 Tax=Anabaena sp. WFMT TaxID=3449730 RepID=UPI003F28FDDC
MRRSGELIRTLTGHLKAVLSVAIHPNGNTLASSSKDGIIKLWNLQTGELLETFSGFSPLIFSSDGDILISGGKSGTIKIWEQVQTTKNLSIIGEWWEILGVNTNTHPDDVKLAYRRLARLYHPDINNSESAKAAMQAVNQAYHNFQTLVNVEK